MGSLIKVQHGFPTQPLLPSPRPGRGSSGPNLFCPLLGSTPRADLHKPNLLLGLLQLPKSRLMPGVPSPVIPMVLGQCQLWVCLRSRKFLQVCLGLAMPFLSPHFAWRSIAMSSAPCFLPSVHDRGLDALLKHTGCRSTPGRQRLFPPIHFKALCETQCSSLLLVCPPQMHFVTGNVIFLDFQPDLTNCLPTTTIFYIPLYKCQVRAF